MRVAAFRRSRLAIVQRLAQLLQIRVDMESAPDRGTTFRLSLSRAEEAPVVADASPAEQAGIALLHKPVPVETLKREIAKIV